MAKKLQPHIIAEPFNISYIMLIIVFGYLQKIQHAKIQGHELLVLMAVFVHSQVFVSLYDKGVQQMV
ncbi:hypothetical protein SDC9_189950 [bioreactor metagenome]|uniref:Uncharacterized protein n=1 Tax=bioreactor metagenome TaxID=1076179 RepID=A0A645I4I6_9ZZZZ